MNLPRISTYSPTTGDRARGKCARVYVNGIAVWFSYRMPVAFCVGPGPMVVRQNTWGPTTGRHINLIDGGGKEARVARLGCADFEREWNRQLKDNSA